MTTLRTRLVRAACRADGHGECVGIDCGFGDMSVAPEHLCWHCRKAERIADAVLAVLASPTDADVERVARRMAAHDDDADWTQWVGEARAAIRALVGETEKQ